MMRTTIPIFTFLFLCCMVVISCAQSDKKQKKNMDKESALAALDENNVNTAGTETAIFATGCFWCTEAVMESLDGVKKVVSGYSGGHDPNPNYKDVCSGSTGHAECVEVTYDPKVITYADLLEAFFRSHDPTSLNRQGNDVGTQYRSAIYYRTDDQKSLAEQAKSELDKSGAYGKPIVTEITKASKFYLAEDYHQNYFANNPDQGYCAFVIAPKLDKFKKVFKEKLRKQI
ncbi:peptide-methionine (S)-S-oxide reductase [Dyadobacter arcticus]|uniref:Peptide methionine sulfoxide reductase MsrA n=2 Tax=Dyadobacter arcticus TaxID=1078754 RepID=A0ABX0UCZ5_9BACT|nr:peptide-methionine (S)-S-oxide reductase [Dyadobacter arcticus]